VYPSYLVVICSYDLTVRSKAGGGGTLHGRCETRSARVALAGKDESRERWGAKLPVEAEGSLAAAGEEVFPRGFLPA
jgi:hypothetical protein